MIIKHIFLEFDNLTCFFLFASLQDTGVYWPEAKDQSLTFGPLEVKMTSVDTEHPHITTRDFKITNDGVGVHSHNHLSVLIMCCLQEDLIHERCGFRKKDPQFAKRHSRKLISNIVSVDYD